MLKKEEIVSAQDLPIEEVSIPEWKGVCLVRGLNSGDRDKYMDSHVKIEAGAKGKDPKVTIANSEALLVAKCLVDEQGNRLFKDSDAPLLAKKSGGAIHKLVVVIERLSGLGKDSDVENFESPQGEGSDTD